jgi:choline kinase
MLELDGRPLLDHAIRALEQAGETEIVVITGHHRASIEAYVAGTRFAADVRTLFNPDYASANNIVSFLAARDILSSGGLLLNSDVVLDPTIVDDVVAAPAGAWLVIDDGHQLDEEDMKVELDVAGRMERISKGLDPRAAHGEYIGLARLDAPAARATLESAAALVAGGRSDLYYEDAFDGAATAAQFKPLSTRGRAWTEVDDALDLERALGIARTLALAADPA